LESCRPDFNPLFRSNLTLIGLLNNKSGAAINLINIYKSSMYILWVGLVSVIIIIFIIGYRKKNTKKEESKIWRDTRKNLTPNATNYNQSLLDRSELERMNKAELQQLLEQLRESEISSLSPRDFHFIQRRLKELE
jgi:hypothetical protein